MTLEQLLDNPSSWETMSESDKEAFFKDALNITRPDRETAIYKESSHSASKQPKLSKAQQFSLTFGDKKDKMNELLKDMDIDLEELL